MKRRNKIKTAAYSLTLFAVMLAWAVSATVRADAYETQVRITRQRALTEMCEYLDSIEVSLTKSLFVNSDKMLSEVSSDIKKQATGAKSSLSMLDSGTQSLLTVNKFLTQAGDFTSYLTKKAATGQEISSEERDTLMSLLRSATSLSVQFDYMSDMMNSDYFSFEEIDDSLMTADNNSESMVSYLSAAGDAEKSMADYPTLIYDGPFSDNIQNKSSVLLENAKEISAEEAKAKAIALLGTDEKHIFEDEPSEGKLASYCYHTETSSVAITKKGGYLSYILGDMTAGEQKLTENDAVEIAAAFLNKAGYTDMVSTYYALNDGVCTVNFAYKKNEYICYPDLIKVSVNVSDGAVVSLDAADYIMNHTEREVPQIAFTEDAVRENISPYLEVKSVSCAVIPSDSGQEYYTYELKCESSDGQDVLVYVDTVTGEEDDILLLLYSDNGTLTK